MALPNSVQIFGNDTMKVIKYETNRIIAPEFDKTAFNCPFCGAYAQQNWINDKVFLQRLFEYQRQFFLDYRKNRHNYEQSAIENFLKTYNLNF